MIENAAPSFLNLDIDLISKIDLSPLAKQFEESAFILGNQKIDDLYYLSFEPEYSENPTPEDYVNKILKLLNAMSKELRELWFQASLRTFNFGFESGVNEPYYSAVISPDSLKQITDFNASITITIYQNVQSDD